MVRVKAILRRASGAATPVRPSRDVLTLSDLTIDQDRYGVVRGGQPIPLTPAEFRLLAALVEADGRVLSRELLLSALYGQSEGEALDRTIDVHIGRLPEKLGDDADRPRYIATVRSAGYRSVKESPG